MPLIGDDARACPVDAEEQFGRGGDDPRAGEAPGGRDDDAGGVTGGVTDGENLGQGDGVRAIGASGKRGAEDAAEIDLVDRAIADVVADAFDAGDVVVSPERGRPRGGVRTPPRALLKGRLGDWSEAFDVGESPRQHRPLEIAYESPETAF